MLELKSYGTKSVNCIINYIQLVYVPALTLVNSKCAVLNSGERDMFQNTYQFIILMSFIYQQVLRYATEMWMAILANQITVCHVEMFCTRVCLAKGV